MSGIMITFYQTVSGRYPVREYIESLQHAERERVLLILKDIEGFGIGVVGASFRHISSKLWEIKISKNRVFYVMKTGGEITLLHAYKKQSQKLPLKERNIAIKRMKEVLP